MKTNILILMLIILATGAWTYLSDMPSNTFQAPQEIVNDFEFKTLRDKNSSLFDYKDNVILLHFWATWCAPCVEELPKLLDLAKNNPEKITIIAIAVADKKQSIQRFLNKIKKSQPDNFIIGLDSDRQISKDSYGTTKLPETYIITPKFRLFEKITGADNNWDSKDWKNNLNELH